MTTLQTLRGSYAGKTALVTGGLGFKGTWLAIMLRHLGARVIVAGHRKPEPDFASQINHDWLGIDVHELDVRSSALKELVASAKPDYVFHLAAQPIVLAGYENPQETFSSNIMGTVNLLEAVRHLQNHVSVVNVTTDKVYRDVKKSEGYVETDELRGLDPYSSSKSCSELVTFSYRTSFFDAAGVPVSTCRAGNVLGGGDYSSDRIVPDIVRATESGDAVGIRNFSSVRPYEHVLDALYAYVLLAARQYDDPTLADEYNVGPNDDCLMATGEIVDYAVKRFGVKVRDESDPNAPHETEILTLDSTKFRQTFGWAPLYDSKNMILERTFDWYEAVSRDVDVTAATINQVRSYLNG